MCFVSHLLIMSSISHAIMVLREVIEFTELFDFTAVFKIYPLGKASTSQNVYSLSAQEKPVSYPVFVIFVIPDIAI